MSPSAINSGPPAHQISGTGKNWNLDPSDFIKMMITQLQNQDPLEPAKNEELLAQMSQIGQLQSTTQLQDSLKTMTLQANIASAGNLIGKQVKGLDDNNKDVNGLVTSVRVEGNDVFLELDNGNKLGLSRVTSISPATTSTATTTAATTPTTGAKKAA